MKTAEQVETHEITQEMIAAGVAAYQSCDSRVDDSESVVQEVYEAMEAIRVSMAKKPR